MALLRNKNNQSHTPTESYWKEVKEKTHALITQILQEKLPLTNLNKLDLDQDEDYLALLPDYQAQYKESFPEAEQIAHEIAYEYLLIVIKSLVKTLKEFTCHDAEYMEGLTE